MQHLGSLRLPRTALPSGQIVWFERCVVPEHYKEQSEGQKRLKGRSLLDGRDLYSSPAVGTRKWDCSANIDLLLLLLL